MRVHDTSERSTLVACRRVHTSASSSGMIVQAAHEAEQSLATLNIATLLPMPSARVRTITAVKSGLRTKERMAALEVANDVADHDYCCAS